ncbi:MAG TPA: helix-turn-helix domain-containing protein [Acidimicrobiia bacterium]|nr:helix-turn-helix domain-containing protein [Acidimicrobiia bacterium]
MANSTYDEKRARTRELLLDAGAELLSGALLDGLAQSLGPVAVSRRAGVSRQTWYRYWSGPPEYIADLLARRLEQLRVDELAHFAQVNATAGDLETMTERIHASARARIAQRLDPEAALPVLVASALLTGPVQRDGSVALVAQALSEYLAGQDRHGQRVIGELLAGWGRTPLAQLGLERLVGILNALSDGVILRATTDPQLYGPQLFADAIVLLLPTLSVPDPSRAPVSVDLTDAASDDDLGGTSQQRAARQRRERTRDRVITAARTEFSARGYQPTTIATIAAASGVSETTIFEHFGSKAGIAAAAFTPAITGLTQALADEASAPILTRIRNHLRRLSDVLHRSPVFVAAYFDIGAYVSAPGRPVDRRDPRLLAPVEAPLVPLVEEAQRAGVVVDLLPARQVAGGITILMLTRVFGYPTEDAETTAEAVEVLALHGALAAAARTELTLDERAPWGDAATLTDGAPVETAPSRYHAP